MEMVSPKDTIISLPNKHLRQKSKKVGSVSGSIKKLVAEMEAATIDWEKSRKHEVGVALAAVQVDNLKRVIIIRRDFNNKQDFTFDVYLNPRITKKGGVVREDFEGCLSIPDIYGKVPRHTAIEMEALNVKGERVKLSAEGFLARVIQHEIDHTNGIVFIDHIKGETDNFYRLDTDGHLEALDYENEVKSNSQLWTK